MATSILLKWDISRSSRRIEVSDCSSLAFLTLFHLSSTFFRPESPFKTSFESDLIRFLVDPILKRYLVPNWSTYRDELTWFIPWPNFAAIIVFTNSKKVKAKNKVSKRFIIAKRKILNNT